MIFQKRASIFFLSFILSHPVVFVSSKESDKQWMAYRADTIVLFLEADVVLQDTMSGLR